MYKEITIKKAIEELKKNPTYFFDYLDHRDDEMVRVYEEDITLYELNLDLYNDSNITAYIFKKNLTIEKSLWNEERDFGIDLLVLGNIKAKNIAVGGQLICIHGNLIVEELLCGSYNHGTMYVYGDVKAKFILCDDYTFCFKNKVDGKVIEGGYYKDFEANGNTSYDTFIENQKNDYWNYINIEAYDVYDNIFNFDGLIKLIKNNENLLVSKEEKLSKFRFDWNRNIVAEMIQPLGSKTHPLDFIFSSENNSLCYKLYNEGINQLIRIEINQEVFEYVIDDKIIISYSNENNPLLPISIESNYKNLYRASCFLSSLKMDIQDFKKRKDSVIQYANNLFISLKSDKQTLIMSSLKTAFYNPIKYYNENLPFFNALSINCKSPFFIAYALIDILQKYDILICKKRFEKLNDGLSAIIKLLKNENIDLEIDIQNLDLKLGRRLQEFIHNLLIINEILKEKNIPLSISIASIGYMENGIVTFCIVKNELKEMIEHLFEMIDIDVLRKPIA
jgi:hypothetical protein